MSIFSFKTQLLFVSDLKSDSERLAYVVDESRFVPRLGDVQGSDSAPSIQGEALAPAGNPVCVDPFPNPHRAPGVKTSRNERKPGSSGSKERSWRLTWRAAPCLCSRTVKGWGCGPIHAPWTAPPRRFWCCPDGKSTADLRNQRGFSATGKWLVQLNLSHADTRTERGADAPRDFFEKEKTHWYWKIQDGHYGCQEKFISPLNLPIIMKDKNSLCKINSWTHRNHNYLLFLDSSRLSRIFFFSMTWLSWEQKIH